MKPTLSARGVGKTFGSGRLLTRVLSDIDIDLYPGELALLIGPSGSGKTTLASILGGLLRPSEGTVELCGTAIHALPERAVARVRRAYLGFVFQSFNLFPALSALDNVAEILAMKGTPLAAARAQAAATLSQVGLGHRLHHLPGQLSGGEKQRVAIARAIAGQPALVIADEPTAALEKATALSIAELLTAQLRSNQTSLLVVTHDRRLVPYASRVIEMEGGRLLTQDATTSGVYRAMG